MAGEQRRPEIVQILQIMKLLSMITPAIAFFQYYSGDPEDYIFNYAPSMAASLIAILLIYFLGEFLKAKVFAPSVIRSWVDPVISLLLLFSAVMLTGTYASSYKFLFLLVIVTSSIECTMRTNLIISGIATAIILAVDLIFAPAGNVNPYFESDVVLACVFMIISWTIGYYVNLENKHIESLNNIANTDGLTGFYNHRFFYESFSEQFRKSKEEGTALSLLFVDIDDFKHYNDVYGHQRGDDALKAVADLMRETLHEDTFIARYGGEEFVVLLPGLGEGMAVKVAERLRLAVQEHSFYGEEILRGKNLTISVGVSSFPAKAKNEEELLKYADDACYRAKFLKKNRVEAYYSILDELKKDMGEPGRDTIASIKTLIAVINAKDKYTYRHIERVVYYCSMLADKMGMNEEEKKTFVYAAYLHDIGKINIPEEILTKGERLTPEEWEILKGHPSNAAEIINSVQSLREVVPIILQHHERHDGKGYPYGLKGDEIHPLARLLIVVDSFDAMTSIRPYQSRKTYSEAIEELRRCSGAQFDPASVQLFISTVRDVFSLY